MLMRSSRHFFIQSMVFCLFMFALVSMLVFSPPKVALADYIVGSTECVAYIGGADIGQSFTVSGTTGLLQSLGVIGNQTLTNATLRVYSGSGYAGTLLHTQTVSLNANPGVFQTLSLDQQVVLTGGQVYTWRLSIASGNVGICATNTS